MKENKYDSEKFFAKYSAMNRSKNGLQGAGWPSITSTILLPWSAISEAG